MIFNVYAIQSDKDSRIYVGISQDVDRRLKEHNAGQVFSTKGYRPWVVVYKEKIGIRQEARKREKYLKSGSGKEYLKHMSK